MPFVGELGPLVRRYYLAVPDVAEDLLLNYKMTYRAEHLGESPSKTVALLVGQEKRAWELWGERTACDPTRPEGCEMCSG